MADDQSQWVLELVGDRCNELPAVLVEALQLIDQLQLPLVGAGAQQSPPEVMTDTQRCLALALRPAVRSTVADDHQDAHGLVPSADRHQEKFAGGVCSKVVRQVLGMVTLQEVVAPHSSWLSDDDGSGCPSPAGRFLDSATQVRRNVGGDGLSGCPLLRRVVELHRH